MHKMKRRCIVDLSVHQFRNSKYFQKLGNYIKLMCPYYKYILGEKSSTVYVKMNHLSNKKCPKSIHFFFVSPAGGAVSGNKSTTPEQ